MTKSLPPKPSVKFLKLEAKSILKAHKNADSSCCDILRHLHQFKGRSNEEILNAQSSLQEVQFALAMEYGFKSWGELKEQVSSAKDQEKRIDNVAMKPFNTSLMGAIRGVADYFNISFSDAMLYGLSGHAFLINIHEVICPSGPYVWKKTGFMHLLENIGIKMVDLGFYSNKSSLEARTKVESSIRKAIDAGMLCSMCNLDNQIIFGYDEQGLLALQPWENCTDGTPERLSFGDWKEFKGEIHVGFSSFNKVAPANLTTAILDSLDYALELNAKPSNFSMKAYGIGQEAYTIWIHAVEKYGSTHGNWWNAIVWSECRSMAAKFFAELGNEYRQVSGLASDLEKTYTEIAKNLKAVSNKELSPLEKSYIGISENPKAVSDKEMPPADKISLLKETKEKEAEAINKIKSFRTSLQKVFAEQE